MTNVDACIEAAKMITREISAQGAFLEMQGGGGMLIDVRDEEETRAGYPQGAILIPRGWLELKLEDAVPDKNTKIFLLCAGGRRSLFAAAQVRSLGYSQIASVQGGFADWKNRGLPIVTTPSKVSRRYARQISVPEFGQVGQEKLRKAHVLIIGAGGLGSPCSLYLAAAGVGKISIVDNDVVELSNLHRQILHSENRIGIPKVNSAAGVLSGLNSAIAIVPLNCQFSSENADRLLADRVDLVVDCSDNFQTRYAANDACVKKKLPLISGAVSQFQGFVGLFGGKAPGNACYRCVFAAPPPQQIAPNCAEAGVLGPVPGIIGVLQAMETLKYICGIGSNLENRLLVYSGLEGGIHSVNTFKRVGCSCSGSCLVPDDAMSIPQGVCSV
jgi:molybdopterin/thiamine biosynthesis adenylyltransferase